MKRGIVLTTLIVLLLVFAGGVWAMSSANYRLDWFTPMTGSGGPASSSGYAVNLTVGQAAIGTANSANYAICLGYWCGGSSAATRHLYLPLVLRG